MTPGMRSSCAVAVVAAAAFLDPFRERSGAGTFWPSGGAVAEWPPADGELGTHHSPLADITPANVQALEVAWTYRTGDVRDGTGERAGTSFEATPIMVDGVLYVSTPFSRAVALDAETGQERWTFDPGLDRSNHMVTSRGVWLVARAPERARPAGDRRGVDGG